MHATVKTGHLILMSLGLFLLCGVVRRLPTTRTSPCKAGFSRSDLRFFYGEPLRIELVAGGGVGEDWYYQFVTWNNSHPTQAGETTTGGVRRKIQFRFRRLGDIEDHRESTPSTSPQ